MTTDSNAGAGAGTDNTGTSAPDTTGGQTQDPAAVGTANAPADPGTGQGGNQAGQPAGA